MGENDNENPSGEVVNIPISEVVVDFSLYPRSQVNKSWVEDLRPSCESQPPAELARSHDPNLKNKIINGVHRMNARLAEGIKTIPVVFVDVESEEEFLDLAISANGKHGGRYTPKECELNAQRLFAMGRSSAEIATKLGTSPRSVRRWLKPLQDENRAEMDARIRELREKGLGFKEIADVLNLKAHATTVARRHRGRAAKVTVGQNAGTSAEPTGGEVASAPAPVDKEQPDAESADSGRGDVGMAEEQQPRAAAPAVTADKAAVHQNTSDRADAKNPSSAVQQVIRAIRTARLFLHRLKNGVPCKPSDNPKLMTELEGLYNLLEDVIPDAISRVDSDDAGRDLEAEDEFEADSGQDAGDAK